MWKALAYYDSCMDVDEIERLKGEPLKKLIKEYGSWSITDKNWKEKDWDFVTNLARIHKDLVSRILFSMRVLFDEKNSSQNVITVRLSFFKPRLQLLAPVFMFQQEKVLQMSPFHCDNTIITNFL